MVRPQKKGKGKRKGGSRHGRQGQDVSFDPDPPVADDDNDGSGSESEDDSLVFDTDRVPEMALNCSIQAIQQGAAASQSSPRTPPPTPPPRRRIPPRRSQEEESHLSLIRYLGRKPSRRSRIPDVPLNTVEPLISYHRKMTRIAPRAAIRSSRAQARRERALSRCPCNQTEETEIRGLRAMQLFMRSPRLFRLIQFCRAIMDRFNAYRLQLRTNGGGQREGVDGQLAGNENREAANEFQLNDTSNGGESNETHETNSAENATGTDQPRVNDTQNTQAKNENSKTSNNESPNKKNDS